AERDQRRLVEWIGRKGGSVTPREVQMGCRWLREPGAAEAALDELAKAGRGCWRDGPPTAKGARPAPVVVRSTLSTSTKPPESGEIKVFVDVDTVDAPENSPPASNKAESLFGSATPAGPYRDGF